MFGDCRVLATMGTNISDNQLYPSNFSFMSNINIFAPIVPKEENGMGMNKEDILEGGSGCEHFSGNEHDSDEQQQPPSKKKRYHRHTAHQIQQMEALFKECPHPDDKQRLKLSQALGLKPRQVKFWFQNRRTQMKAQQDRHENAVLRAENDSLKNENYRLQATLRNVVCPNCGGASILGEMGCDEQRLRIENAHLKEEYERVCCLVSQYVGRPTSNLGPDSVLAPSVDLDMTPFSKKFEQDSIINFPEHMIPLPFMSDNSCFPDNLLILDEEKSLAMELAVSSVNELMKMCSTEEPLWVRSSENSNLVLNIDEYNKLFSCAKRNTSEFRIEATKESAVVIMNSITLVDAFLDANKWMELFPSIVSRAKTLQVVYSDDSEHASGSLQLMYAELQVLSPLVPTREAHFLRYCQHNAEEGSWAIVDFPIEGFQNMHLPSSPCYVRRPSGCVIQDMPNGYSRVIWMEHAEIEDVPLHQAWADFVRSGAAFGAQSWLAVLQGQCERLASLMARNLSDIGVIPSLEARKSLMNLSKRMMRTFCLNMSTCNRQSWTALSDSTDDTIRITTRKVTEPGQPNGLILSAVSSIWLPYCHNHVFDFLRDEKRRAQLEVLSNGNSLHEVAHIANGSHPGNSISLLRVNVASNSSQSVELVLQESCSDNSKSMVVYATVDVEAIQMVMNGEDSSTVPLLPLGFVIHPMNQISNESTERSNDHSSDSTGLSGCLLTIGLQVLASTNPAAKLNLSSVTAVDHHMRNVMQQISTVLGNNSGNFSIQEPEVKALETAINQNSTMQ